YSITEVPAVPGSTSLLATAIDGRGDIVGTYYVPNKSGDVDARAFLYDASKGTTQRIGGNDGSTIQMANGVNDSLAVALSTDARRGAPGGTADAPRTARPSPRPASRTPPPRAGPRQPPPAPPAPAPPLAHASPPRRARHPPTERVRRAERWETPPPQRSAGK